MLASSRVNPLNRFWFKSLALLARKHGVKSEGGREVWKSEVL
jgi:hypothetical protein